MDPFVEVCLSVPGTQNPLKRRTKVVTSVVPPAAVRYAADIETQRERIQSNFQFFNTLDSVLGTSLDGHARSRLPPFRSPQCERQR